MKRSLCLSGSVFAVVLSAVLVASGCKSSGSADSSTANSTKSSSGLNREQLLKGSPVPDRREFPLSSKIGACQDFHAYVCSEVENNFKLPADRERWTFSFTDISERLLHAKKQFFSKIDSYEPKSPRGHQFKDTYLACMNEKASAAEEQAYVKEEKARILGLKSWQELADLSQSRIDSGDLSFVSFGSNENKQKPEVNDVILEADMRSLPERSYYENKELMAEFEPLVSQFFKTIGVDQPEQRARWVVDFEKSLAMKYPLPKDLRPRYTENRDISRADFLKKYPNLRVERFLKKVPQKTVLLDIVPESNEFINKAFPSLPLEQLKSVYLYHSLVGYLDDAYPDYFNKQFAFRNKFLGGSPQRPVRQERCTKGAIAAFGMELDYELMDILFPAFPQDRMIKVGESVRKSIIDGLEKNAWLSTKTKQAAILKIKSSQLHLVKPQVESDWDFVPLRTYSSEKRYANARLYRQARIEKGLKELAEPRVQTRWAMPPLMVNAYYSPPDNKFVLPLGILQFPFFDSGVSDIENTAAIGVVVGHELGHGVDDQGAQYDHKGRVRKWFSDADLKTFKERGAKFVAQFNAIGHDGKLTLGENIGDHVGLTSAYRAAFPQPQSASAADKQKFFVAYARMWCTVMVPSMKERMLKTDPHSLGQERINQQVIHLDGFSEAFSCKAGDKMYLEPKDRIRVW